LVELFFSEVIHPQTTAPNSLLESLQDLEGARKELEEDRKAKKLLPLDPN